MMQMRRGHLLLRNSKIFLKEKNTMFKKYMTILLMGAAGCAHASDLTDADVFFQGSLMTHTRNSITTDLREHSPKTIVAMGPYVRTFPQYLESGTFYEVLGTLLSLPLENVKIFSAHVSRIFTQKVSDHVFKGILEIVKSLEVEKIPAAVPWLKHAITEDGSLLRYDSRHILLTLQTLSAEELSPFNEESPTFCLFFSDCMLHKRATKNMTALRVLTPEQKQNIFYKNGLFF